MSAAPTAAPPRPTLEGYREVRAATEALAAPLSPEDQTVSSMPDVSPTKWHRAHTTWFFEQFVLLESCPGYEAVDDRYLYLFNSYYEGAGPRHARAERGLLTRPGVAEVAGYRSRVDGAVADLLAGGVEAGVAATVELGLHHEQQHQELLLMDVKHVLGTNPYRPAYRPAPPSPARVGPLRWHTVDGGLVEVGLRPGDGFGFDHEGPAHRVWLEPYAVADRLVTCGEWLEFMGDRGYERPELWLSDGWSRVRAEGRRAPLYWDRAPDGSGWILHTLGGHRPVEPTEPVVHVDYYEADAFAHWAGARLPTEAEWEHAADAHAGPATPAAALHPAALHPAALHPASTADGGWYGQVWQWTASAYLAYPGFRPAPGVVGEYNGKFMAGQQVLRGSACVTPAGHTRPSYRNFFPPHAQWAFSGVRLARDAS